jgi:hypothetical protein
VRRETDSNINATILSRHAPCRLFSRLVLHTVAAALSQLGISLQLHLPTRA